MIFSRSFAFVFISHVFRVAGGKGVKTGLIYYA